jgi:peptide deformylase
MQMETEPTTGEITRRDVLARMGTGMTRMHMPSPPRWPASRVGRPILLYPHPALKSVCASVAVVDEAARAVAADLVEALEASPGVGVAAPQIGELRRIIVVDAGRNLGGDRRPRHSGQGRFVLFNPEIVARSGEQLFREGCLSLPDYTADIRRARSIRVRALDPAGEPVEIDVEGFEAVVFQHEIDHLDGLLFLDRVADLKTDLFRRNPCK